MVDSGLRIKWKVIYGTEFVNYRMMDKCKSLVFLRQYRNCFCQRITLLCSEINDFHGLNICWFHGSFFKGFSIVFPAPQLAKVKSSENSNGMSFCRHFFSPYLFYRCRNNRRDKQRNKFWREKCSENHI